MRFFNFLKERNILLPALGALLIISCFIFFMMFNLGIETFKNSRGLASEGVRSGNAEIEEVVIKSLSGVLEERAATHSQPPSKEEHFLFGFLKGNYKAFKVGDKIVSLKPKGGQAKSVFPKIDQKKDLAHKFKAVYFSSDVALADPEENRYMASEQVSYSLVENGIIAGRLDFRFSKDQELLSIRAHRL